MDPLRSARKARVVRDGLVAFGCPVPDDLTEVIALLDEATAYQGPPTVDVRAAAASLRPGEVADLLDANARANVLRANLASDRGELIEGLLGRMARVLIELTDAALAALEDRFITSAAKLETAIRVLPAGWSDYEQLVRAGAKAVTAFSKAKVEADTLDQLAAIRAALPTDDHHSQTLIGTRFAKVRDSLVADRVVAASEAGPLGVWGAILAIEGVEGLTWWRSVQAHHDYAASVPVVEERLVSSVVLGGLRGVSVERVEVRS